MTDSRESDHLTGVKGVALGVLVACVLAGNAAAAPGDVTVNVSQVADIHPGASNSSPDRLAVVGDTLFFRALGSTTTGFELWKSGPPYTSATMVENISPTSGESSNPGDLTAVGTTLFFSADDGTGGTGTELWKSVPPYDSASTSQVEDILPGAGASNPSELANVNGTLYFAAGDSPTNNELWKSEPPNFDAASTSMVKDISMSGSSFPYDITQSGGTIFFGANDGTNGDELWKTNGTEAGTTTVANINTGSPPGSNAGASADPSELTDVGGTLLFGATDDVTGTELWRSDGGAIGMGTAQVADLNAAGSSDPVNLLAVGNTLLFGADNGVTGNELRKSVSPFTSVMEVADLNAGQGDTSFTDRMVSLGGTVFFGADTGSDCELFATAPGYTSAAPITSGPAAFCPFGFTGSGMTLFFAANDGTFGQELWKSNGTGASTQRVSDINLGSGDSTPSDLTDVNGTLLFAANDDLPTANELWKATQTVEGPPPAVTTPAVTPTTPPAKKRCKKGRKLKKGKCVKKKRKRKK